MSTILYGTNLDCSKDIYSSSALFCSWEDSLGSLSWVGLGLPGRSAGLLVICGRSGPQPLQDL